MGGAKAKKLSYYRTRGNAALVCCRGEMGGQLYEDTEVWALLMEPGQKLRREVESGLTLTFSMRDGLDQH